MHYLYRQGIKYISVVIWRDGEGEPLQKLWLGNGGKMGALQDLARLQGYVQGLADAKAAAEAGEEGEKKGRKQEMPRKKMVFRGVVSMEELVEKRTAAKGRRYGQDEMMDVWREIYREVEAFFLRPRRKVVAGVLCAEPTLEERLMDLGDQLEILRDDLALWCREAGALRRGVSYQTMCWNAMFRIVDFDKADLRESFKEPFLLLARLLGKEPEYLSGELYESDFEGWD